MSRPLDRRLLAAAPALRPYLAGTALGQLLAGLLTVAQAGLLASILVGVFSHHEHGRGLLVRLGLLAGVGIARALLAATQEWLGARASTQVRAQLRRATLQAVIDSGPAWIGRQPAGRLVNAVGPGPDALDGYVTRALPALVSASLVPPIVLAWITFTDWQSGLLFLMMLPLVPVFMALVGVTTKRRVQRQYELLARMSGHFLDLVRGLTTLTVYGQVGRQQRTLREATERYRRETMSALKVAFLSALVLDLVAALSVAVVAVDVGLRLDSGGLSFTTALVVLLLAPELFAPLRAVGAQYHANQEGATSAAAALDVIDEAPARGDHEPPTVSTNPDALLSNGMIALDGVTVRFPGREHPALYGVFLAAQPGELIALVGRSGAGKSTAFAAMLGFVSPDRGQVLVGTGPIAGQSESGRRDQRMLIDLADVDIDAWRLNTAWLPQRPTPTQPTIAAEVRLGDPTADDAMVAAACRRCRTPSPETQLGEDGGCVSAGQRRRIALARVLLRVESANRRGAIPLVLLDEPSEDLDRQTERIVAAVIGALAGRATVLIATHSEVLAALTDRRVVLDVGQIISNTRQKPVTRSTTTAAEGEDWLRPQHASVVPPAAPSDVPPDAPPVARLGLRKLIGTERLWPKLIAAAGLSALAGLAGLALTGSSIWLISRAAEHPNVQALAIAVVGVRAFALSRALLRYLERLSAHDAALRALVGLRTQVFAALGPLGPSALGGFRRGDLLRRFVGDVDGLQDGLVRAFVPWTGAAVTSAGACLLAGLLVPLAGASLAVGLLLAGGLLPWAAARAAGSAGQSDELVGLVGRRDEASSALIDGLAELTAYGAADAAAARIASIDGRIARRSRRPALAATVGTGVSGALAAITLPIVLALGAAAVDDGQLSGISLGVLAICVLIGFEAVAPLPSAFAAWARCRAGLGRVARVLSTAPAFVDPEHPEPPPAHAVGIKAQRLLLRPSPGAHEVLSDAQFSVAAGTRTALVGPSGSGKSTLLAAILRLRRADSGVIELGDAGRAVELSSLRAADLPPLAAGSLQGDHVFDASLRDNLRVVRPAASDSDLDAVAGRAGLTAFISSLPRGWSTLAGADGAALSGGQRQRLLLARALLANPQILVLDEPTAHLDGDTEREVLDDLLSATAGRTVLMSTHRRLRTGQVDATLDIQDGALVQEAAGWAGASQDQSQPGRDFRPTRT